MTGRMAFGVFDQNDRNGRPLADQYEERLRLVELYDRLGFRTYHVSEHHGTPLSAAPSPSVLLSAVIQRTTRLRVCPLVYLLPMYHPLRLAEEICMLDHLSRGRFEFGIGRGASPHELAAFGVDPEEAVARHAEAHEVLQLALSGDGVTHAGRFWRFADSPVTLRPFQQPRPPMWYAAGSPDSAAWPARQGAHLVCGGPVARMRAIADRFRAEFDAAHPGAGAAPLVGAMRFVVVAETEAEALAIGRAAWGAHHDSFWHLWHRHGTQPANIRLPPAFEQVLEAGQGFAGTPGQVAEAIAAQVAAGGLTYLLGVFCFGTMPFADAAESVRLFGERVMPELAAGLRVAA